MGLQARLSHGNANLSAHGPDLSFETLRLFPEEPFCWDFSFADTNGLFSEERVCVASLKQYFTTQLGITELHWCYTTAMLQCTAHGMVILIFYFYRKGQRS